MPLVVIVIKTSNPIALSTLAFDAIRGVISWFSERFEVATTVAQQYLRSPKCFLHLKWITIHARRNFPFVHQTCLREFSESHHIAVWHLCRSCPPMQEKSNWSTPQPKASPCKTFYHKILSIREFLSSSAIHVYTCVDTFRLWTRSLSGWTRDSFPTCHHIIVKGKNKTAICSLYHFLYTRSGHWHQKSSKYPGYANAKWTLRIYAWTKIPHSRAGISEDYGGYISWTWSTRSFGFQEIFLVQIWYHLTGHGTWCRANPIPLT